LFRIALMRVYAGKMANASHEGVTFSGALVLALFNRSALIPILTEAIPAPRSAKSGGHPSSSRPTGFSELPAQEQPAQPLKEPMPVDILTIRDIDRVTPQIALLSLGSEIIDAVHSCQH
jgi:hypothetical protein